jgi:hypothetical protein
MTELVLTEPLLESWPQRVNGALVEPGAGVVRIRPTTGHLPIELSIDQARLLAAAARTNRQRILLNAVEEAERQERVLVGLLEADEDEDPGASQEAAPVELRPIV